MAPAGQALEATLTVTNASEQAHAVELQAMDAEGIPIGDARIWKVPPFKPMIMGNQDLGFGGLATLTHARGGTSGQRSDLSGLDSPNRHAPFT